MLKRSILLCVFYPNLKRERQRAVLHRQARMRTEVRIRGTQSKPRDTAASRGHSPAVLTTDFGAQNWEGTARTAVGTGMHRIIGGEWPWEKPPRFHLGCAPARGPAPLWEATVSRQHAPGGMYRGLPETHAMCWGASGGARGLVEGVEGSGGWGSRGELTPRDWFAQTRSPVSCLVIGILGLLVIPSSSHPGRPPQGLHGCRGL